MPEGDIANGVIRKGGELKNLAKGSSIRSGAVLLDSGGGSATK